MLYRIDPIPPGTSPAEKSILARRALGALLARYFGVGSLPEIAVDGNGKPFFLSMPHIHFSLSHCESAVMAAVDTREIGCDIEDIQPAPDASLLHAALSPSEIEEVVASGNPGETFTRLWTRKEAEVKRLGAIPDDPRHWPSSSPNTLTSSSTSSLSSSISPSAPYIFSISLTP